MVGAVVGLVLVALVALGIWATNHNSAESGNKK